MQAVLVKRQEENCTERYSKGENNQNGEYLVNLCELNSLDIWVTFSYSKLPITLFPLKVRITKHLSNSSQSYRRWMHLGISITCDCLLNRSVSVPSC